MDKKVSVIIPARNEEKFLGRIIASLRNQTYKNVEVIVVVNGSIDKTEEIAKVSADKSLVFEKALGYSIPRNEGAKISSGQILLFVDADTRLPKEMIAKIVEKTDQMTVGTCLCQPDVSNIKAKLFIGFKNFLHRIKIFKSVSSGGMLFCGKEIFLKTGGFGDKRTLGEFYDFIKRAIKCGGQYTYLTSCYSIVSMRRFEEKGYLATFWFWLKYGISSLFGCGKKIAEKYILNK